MSDSHYEKPWFDRFWQVGLIAFGVFFTLCLALIKFHV